MPKFKVGDILSYCELIENGNIISHSSVEVVKLTPKGFYFKNNFSKPKWCSYKNCKWKKTYEEAESSLEENTTNAAAIEIGKHILAIIKIIRRL